MAPISTKIPRGLPPSLIKPGISLVICRTLLEHRQRDLVAVGFTPSINSKEIVQLIKMITTQLLPAAGLLPLVFTLSCEVKEVGESCRYVWLAVWISGIWYPEVFFSLQPSQLGETEGGREFWKNVPLKWKKKGGKKNHTALLSLRKEGSSQRGHYIQESVNFFLIKCLICS